MSQPQYKFYPTRDRKQVSVKPWGYELAKLLAHEEELPMSKIFTDAVEYVYSQRQAGKFEFRRECVGSTLANLE